MLNREGGTAGKEARDRLNAAQNELHRAEVNAGGTDIQHAETALFEQYGVTRRDREPGEAVAEVRNRQQAGQSGNCARAWQNWAK